MTFGELMRSRPMLRGALLAPSVVALIFCLFNLTAAVDQDQALRSLSVAIVDHDQGAAAPTVGSFRLAERALVALERQIPLRLARFGDVASATDALDHGLVVGVVVLPADFTATAVAGNPPEVQVLHGDHLSLLETQVGRQLPRQVQAALSLVVLAARPQLAALRPYAPEPVPAAPAATAVRPPAGEPVVPAVPVPRVSVRPIEAPPATPLDAIGVAPAPELPTAPAAPVLVASTALHAAASPLLLQAPFVMGFASWLGGLIGSVLLLIGTRQALAAGHVRVVLTARTVLPLVAAVLAALVAVATVSALTNTWEHFWELWAFRALSAAATMLTLTALFSLLGFLAFVPAVPLVFYQAVVGGALAPAAAAPDWLAWLGRRMPLAEMTEGLRALLIGGAPDAVQWTGIALLFGLALLAVWAGTVGWGVRYRLRA